MSKISGYICSSNSTKLDYCLREAALSLVPICDEVVLSIGPSEDDTREIAERLCCEHANIRLIDYPVPMPVRRITWWPEWLNWTRERLCYPNQLTLDADEVLDPAGYDTIRKAAEHGECRWFRRFNYWGDIKHVAPHGRVCGEQVVRLAPTSLWMCSDEPHPDGQPEYEIRTRAGWPPCATPELIIHHLGFLRKPECFVGKIRAVNGAFFGSSDDRVERAHAEGVHWTTYCPFDIPILDADGTPPEVCHQWLRDRGHM